MGTISFSEFVKKTGGKPNEVKVFNGAPNQDAVPQKKGFFEDLGGDIVETARDVGGDLKKGWQGMVDAEVSSIEGKRNPILAGADLVASGLAGLGNAVGSIFKGAGKAVLPQSAEDKVAEVAQGVGEQIAQQPVVQEAVQWYNGLDDETKLNLRTTGQLTEAVLNVLSLGGAKVVGTAAKEGLEEVGTQVVKQGTKAVVNATEKVADATKGVRDVASMGVESVSRIPSRIATNVAEKQAVREAVKELPTKTAQIAARDGIDIPDVKYLYEMPADQKKNLRTLATVAKDFAAGKTKTNPIEVVGKPINTRLKELESARGTIGKELGEVANTLGSVTSKELGSPVFNALRKVQGLAGLKIDGKGVLDFTDTVLSTALTRSDRKAIQKVFTEAVKNGTGKQKHLLRQELFEILGGKKKSLTNMTATEEKAYNAIREGLSTVLEGKNAKYKVLSNDYRKVIQPLTDMRKFMKNVAGADEDILDMSAGLLARRLTSNSMSNPQIRQILRAMDEATKVKGKSRLSVENLQDFYNVLDKYYDIAGKTGFQGQVTSGIEGASTVQGVLLDTLKNFSGKSNAVRQKALEDALEEALR